MYVHEVAQMLRDLADDPDQTFFSDTNLVAALQQGYREFRNLVFKAAPEVYETSYSLNVSGPSAALAGVLFGATPTQTRCLRITRIERVSDTSASATFQGLLEPASSRANLYSSWVIPRWTLQGTTLLFSGSLTQALRIVYLPADTVNWTAGIITGSNVYIDDLQDFHDLIALLAYKQYAIKDFALNPVLAEQLRIRLQDFSSFLTAGRTGDADRWVSSEDEGWW